MRGGVEGLRLRQCACTHVYNGPQARRRAGRWVIVSLPRWWPGASRRRPLGGGGVLSVVREALACHGELFRVWANTTLPRLQAGPAAQQQPQPRRQGGPVVLVQTVVLGIGDEIMHPWLAEA